MQRGRWPDLDVRPFQFAGLLGPQAVAIARQDQAGVAMSPASALRRLHQLFDLGRQQILAAPHLGIGQAPRARLNLPVYVTWFNQVEMRIHWRFPPCRRSTYRITRIFPVSQSTRMKRVLPISFQINGRKWFLRRPPGSWSGVPTAT